MNKILKIIIDIILLLVIIVIVGYFILRVLGKMNIFNVETGSMEDRIHVGDYILLYKQTKYQVGDVITYRVDDYYVTHRIIKIDGDKITTKGDANNTPDEEIDDKQIEGKVVYCGGLLNILINYKFVIVALLVCLYLLSCYINRNE